MSRIFTLNKNYGKIMIIILSVGFLFIFYPEIIINPNRYLFKDTGDGIKNYYTYNYHIAHDTSYVNFQGMNYPYGENIFFIDCHPVIANTYKAAIKIFPGLQDFSIGFLNLFMILSYVFCALIVYLILIRFEIPVLFSLLGALGVTILTPQTIRLQYGHFALFYSFFFPLSWYLYIRLCDAVNKTKWAVFLFINTLFWYFISGYLGFIITLFLLFIWLIEYIIHFRSKSGNFKYYLFLFIQVLVPVMIFRGFLFFTEIHTGRAPYPDGFFKHTAALNTVFLPNHGPSVSIYEIFINIGDQMGKGLAYVGTTSNIVILLVIIIAAKAIIRKKWRSLDQYFPGNTGVYLLSAICLLMFSMAYPFRWNMEFLLDFFPELRQFRCLGRFAWGFYYVFTVFSICFIYRLFTNTSVFRNKSVGIICIVLLYILMILEGIPYHKSIAPEIVRSTNYFSNKYLPGYYKSGFEKIDNTKYQAILPMPFYLQGSGHFGRPGTYASQQLSMIISYYTQLPITGARLTRTSIPESKKICQFLSPNFYEKEIYNDLPDQRPFLITYTGEGLLSYESNIINKAKKIFNCEQYELYEIDFNQMFDYNFSEDLYEFLGIKYLLSEKQGLYITDTSDFVYLNDYESLSSDKCYRGRAAYSGSRKDDHVLLKTGPGVFRGHEYYLASFWYYNKGIDQNSVEIFVYEIDQQKRKIINRNVTDPIDCVVINGDWSLVELGFFVEDTGNTFLLMIKGDKNCDRTDTIFVDDLLIRPVKNNVYSIKTDNKGRITKFFKNNHLIDMKKMGIGEKEYKELILKYYIDQINNSQEWMDHVKEKAFARDIDLEQMVKMDAEYMYKRFNSEMLEQ